MTVTGSVPIIRPDVGAVDTNKARSTKKHPGSSSPTRQWSGPWLLAAFGFALAFAIFAVLTFQFLPSRYALNEGEVSSYDIKAPAKVTYVSQLRTNAERQRAAATIPDIYRPIPDALSRAQTRATSALDQITQIRRDASTPADRVDRIGRISDLSLSAPIIEQIVAQDDIHWQTTVIATQRLLDRTMRGRITAPQLSEVRLGLSSQLSPGLDERDASIVIALAQGFISPTEEIDQAATADARKDAADSVQPIRLTIEKGETILRNGDIVSAEDIEKLEATGLRNPTIRWSWILAMGLLAVVMTALLCTFVYRYQPVTAASPRRLLLIGVLLIIPILATKLVVPGREYYGYLFPVAAAPMLLTILLDAPIAIIVTVLQAIGIGLVTNSELDLVVTVLIAGSLGALTVHRMERMNVLTLAAGVVALTDFAIIVAFREIAGDLDAQHLALYGLLALVSGGLSAALTLGTVSFLGQVFGITTTLNLLELAHPSQPLFRRLLNEAPGSYHHSVLVANLAERAAAAIGADTLLVRIGGYYHDIGKLSRPYAFIENQMDGENIHDQLDAYTSARIILAHVSDGLQLAVKYGIPSRIQDLIAQHHGTMLVQYFYRQACQGAESSVDESAFRYPGPKPQTREAGIMMLADGVEATVRASRDHSAEIVTRIVDKIIQDRVTSGQLDECELTLSDLRKVRQAFIAVLQSIYHPRIEYPPDRPRATPVAEPLGPARIASPAAGVTDPKEGAIPSRLRASTEEG